MPLSAGQLVYPDWSSLPVSCPSCVWQASLLAQTVKNLRAVQGTCVQSLDQEDPLEKGIATHSSILAWEIPQREESSRLLSMGLLRVRHD